MSIANDFKVIAERLVGRHHVPAVKKNVVIRIGERGGKHGGRVIAVDAVCGGVFTCSCSVNVVYAVSPCHRGGEHHGHQRGEEAEGEVWSYMCVNACAGGGTQFAPVVVILQSISFFGFS